MDSHHPFIEIEARDLTMLTARFPRLIQRDLVINMDGPAHLFFDEIREGLLKKGRRGEVVLIARRPDGRLWLHRKSFYPPDAYRLLSGGIKRDEPALVAAARELWEETSLSGPIVASPGVLRYTLQRAGIVLRFISYFFVVEVSDTAPAPRDAGERICDFRPIAPAELPAVAAALRAVPPDWQDWGIFRAIGHEFVLERWGAV